MASGKTTDKSNRMGRLADLVPDVADAAETPDVQETAKTGSEKSNGAGRPAGAANRDYEVARTVAKRCMKCDLTEFEKRSVRVEREMSGIAPDGKPFNRIRWITCRCKACGQWHVFVEHEMLKTE